jgi:hypothetical protein
METGAVSASCLTGPSPWWPFAVHLAWPVQCTLALPPFAWCCFTACFSDLDAISIMLAVAASAIMYIYVCTLMMVQFATSLIKKEGNI